MPLCPCVILCLSTSLPVCFCACVPVCFRACGLCASVPVCLYHPPSLCRSLFLYRALSFYTKLNCRIHDYTITYYNLSYCTTSHNTILILYFLYYTMLQFSKCAYVLLCLCASVTVCFCACVPLFLCASVPVASVPPCLFAYPPPSICRSLVLSRVLSFYT